MTTDKWMWIVTGPHGSGKSSFIQGALPEALRALPHFNPDVEMQKLRQQGAKDMPPELLLQAARENEKRVQEYRRSGQSFMVETTTPGLTYGKLASQLRKEGWKVGVIALGIATPELAIERVSKRVAKGGHGVPENVIRGEWEACIMNTPQLLTIADEAIVYDTTSGNYNEVMHRPLNGRLQLTASDKGPQGLNRYMKEFLEQLHAHHLLGARAMDPKETSRVLWL